MVDFCISALVFLDLNDEAVGVEIVHAHEGRIGAIIA